MEITARTMSGAACCIETAKAAISYYQLDHKEIILLNSGYMMHGGLDLCVRAIFGQ